MFGSDGDLTFQIGDGARHFEHAVISACRQIEPADGLLQQRDALFVRRAQCIDFSHRKLRVGFALARDLALPRDFHALLDGGAGFAFRLVEQVILRHRRHFDLDVDTIQQWTGDLAAVARDLIGRAAAFAVVMAVVTARAGTRCLFTIRPGVPQVIDKKAL